MSQESQLNDAPEEAGRAPGQSYMELWRIARRRKSLILLGAVGGLVLGALYYAMAHPVYESKAQLLVIRKRPADVPGLSALRTEGNEDYLSTQAGILRSPLIAGRAIQEHDLASLPGVRNSGDPTGAIAAQLRATRDPKDLRNSILEVSYRCGDEQSSAIVLTGVLDSYQKFLDEAYSNVRNQAVKLMSEARDKLAKELDAKESVYRKFRHEQPILLMRGQNGSSFNGDQLLLIHARQMDRKVRRQEIEDRLQAIDQALKDGRSREELTAMVAQAMVKSSDGLAVDATGQLVNSTLEDKLLPALLEEKMLLEDYGPNHPQVQAVRKKVELARSFVLETLRQELNGLQSSEKVLADAFKEHADDARKSVDYEIEDDGQKGEILRLQQLYDITIKQLQDVDLLKDMGGFDAQTISPPSTRKVSPQGTTIFPLALLLGLAFGCGAAYLAEVSDKTFRNAEDIRRRLALPVVGHIPRIQLKPQTLELIAASGSELDPMLAAYHRPKSREAEAYRGVRTALYFSTRGSGHRLIQVTSPSPADGKTTLAANLAVSIAQSGKRVLLIDADLRKPRQHTVFNVPDRVGLSAVIAGECDPVEAIHETAVPGLSVMPCGRVPPNPAELLTSPRFQEALGALGTQYDFVLIDTPPLLAVTDPSVVAARVDGVVLTLRITKNGRPQAERAKDILQTLGAPIFGVVVNGIGPAAGGYGYGYGYGYGDSYYYSPSGDERGSGRRDGYYENEDASGHGQPPGPAAKVGEAGRNGSGSQPEAGHGQG
jgi:capsular exopolysaccharide synthesis family protein